MQKEAMNRLRTAFLILTLLPILPVFATGEDEGSFLPFWLEMPIMLLAIIFIPVALIVLFVGMYKKVFRTIWYFLSLQPLRRLLLRQRLSRGLEYYRDAPAGGDLKVANVVKNSLSSSLLSDYKGLFGALILRLVDSGALKMEYKSNVYGSEPHVVLSIGTWPTGNDPTKDMTLERRFHHLLTLAAGSDKVLQPRELQHYFRYSKDNFLRDLTTLTESQRKVAEDPETAKQLLALKKYLLDFSLIKERDISELKLWKEYLVYALFFGIADKVCNNFEEVYPDYFKGNLLASMQLNIVGNNALVTYIDAADKGARESLTETAKKDK